MSDQPPAEKTKPPKQPKAPSQAHLEVLRRKEQKLARKEQDRLKELEKANAKKNAATTAPAEKAINQPATTKTQQQSIPTNPKQKQSIKPNQAQVAQTKQQQQPNKHPRQQGTSAATSLTAPAPTAQSLPASPPAPFCLETLLPRRITKIRKSASSAKFIEPSVSHKLILSSALEHFNQNDSVLLASSHDIVRAFFEADVGESVDVFGVVDGFCTRQHNLIRSRFQDAGYFMDTITKVVLSADAVFKNGTLLTQPGTLYLAMLAHEHGIPVVALVEASKYVDQNIWQKELSEHQGVHFDLVDASYVNVLVTEAGMVNPCSISTLINQLYPA